MRKLTTGLLTALVLSAGICISVNAEDLAGNEYQLGNSSQNLLNGGIISEQPVDIREEGYSGLNVFEDSIYYVSQDRFICKVARDTEKKEILYTSQSRIDELCVVNDSDIYFLENGNVYQLAQHSRKVTAVSVTGDVKGMIPTPYGTLLTRGDVFEWKLYAEDRLLLSNIYQYYTEEGHLVYTREHKQYQIELSRLFSEDFSSDDIEQYSLGADAEDVIETYSHTEEDGVCEECERNAREFSEERYEESQKAAPGLVSEGEISAYAVSSLSAAQYEMVQRAEDQACVSWTPQADVMGWNNQFTFKKGTTYNGIPYGQPVYAAYVPYKANLSEFVQAVDNPESKFYTERSTYNKTAPYYSSDCSCFVSYSWGLVRNTTRTLAKEGYIQQGGVYSLQVGDILLYEGSHVKMVEDVVYTDGKVTSITVIEQTPPIILRTVYGGSSRKTLGDLDKEIQQEGTTGKYVICRRKGALDGGPVIDDNNDQTGIGKYTDISKNAWYYPYIENVVEKEIMTGINPTTFAPEERLVRAQLAMMLYRIHGNPEEVYEQKFSDVTDGQFYSLAVTWASDYEIVTGYSNGSFGPADWINREQLATMLYRYACKQGYKTNIFKDDSIYPDADKVTEYAADAVRWCLWNGIITGDGGKLNPQGEVDRAVAATMISRFIDWTETEGK